MAQRDPTKPKRRKQAHRDAPAVSESPRTDQGSFGLLAPRVEPLRTAGLLAPSVPVAVPVSNGNDVPVRATSENLRVETASEVQGAPDVSRSNQSKTDIREIDLRDLESPLKIVRRIQSGEPVRLSPKAVGSLTDEETGEDFSDDYVSTYSSRGPTLTDHFLKPDLVAPGQPAGGHQVGSEQADAGSAEGPPAGQRSGPSAASTLSRYRGVD